MNNKEKFSSKGPIIGEEIEELIGLYEKIANYEKSAENKDLVMDNQYNFALSKMMALETGAGNKVAFDAKTMGDLSLDNILSIFAIEVTQPIEVEPVFGEITQTPSYGHDDYIRFGGKFGYTDGRVLICMKNEDSSQGRMFSLPRVKGLKKALEEEGFQYDEEMVDPFINGETPVDFRLRAKLAIQKNAATCYNEISSEREESFIE